jgi:hypothetical protein
MESINQLHCRQHGEQDLHHPHSHADEGEHGRRPIRGSGQSSCLIDDGVIHMYIWVYFRITSVCEYATQMMLKLYKGNLPNEH